MPITCPHCRNPIYDEDALLCHFCGESLQRAGGGLMGNLKYGPLRVVLIAAALLTALGLLLLYTF